jgi:hypothetical protein
MAAWMKYAQPGDGHRFLRQLAGSWKASTKLWMEPGGPPMESTGTSVNELIMGGRYLKSDYTGELMKMPFQGMALDGFDNRSQKHTGIWIDSMGTAMMVFEGACDEEGKLRTMIAEFTDGLSGRPARMKGVTTVVGENEHRYEAWTTGPDGESFKTMEIVYKRS